MIATTFLIAVALAQQPLTQAAAPTDPRAAAERTAEDIEVMRRVLVNELDALVPRTAPEGAPLSDEQATLMSVYRVNAFSWGTPRVATSARGFRVPGTGAVFAIDVEAPLREVEESPEPPQESTSDEWEEARRELDARRRPSSSGNRLLFGLAKEKRRRYEIDAAFVDRAVAAVKAAARKHGHRISGLGPDESILVLLHVAPGSSALPLETPRAEGDAASYVYWLDVPGANVRPQHVVVRVPVGAAAEKPYLDDRVEPAAGGGVHRY